MPDPTLLAPVSDDQPCGADLQWDPELAALEHSFGMATAEAEEVVEGESEDGAQNNIGDVLAAAHRLCERTKDMRVLTILAEATWRHQGLAAFADALTDLVTVAESWPDADAGFYPRADEEDGDLGERNAPLARFVARIPMLVEVSGWGNLPAPAQQQEVREALAAVFNAWNERLEPSFGGDLASPREAWAALRKLVGDATAPETEPETGGRDAAGAAGAAMPAMADAWDALDHTLQLMLLQNGHSPAIPVLRLIATWRDVDIIAIAEGMSEAGVTLEQLLEAIKKRLDAG